MNSPEKTPRVSIGMPVYNGERYIEEAVESLLAQTFSDFELIISDNGSTDRTKEIALSLAEKDKRIRVVANSVNRGAAYNYNSVFKLSRGKYFKWASHDDLCFPTLLERCVQVLDDSPDAVLCFTKARLIADDGSTLEDYKDNLNLFSSCPAARLLKLRRHQGLLNCVFGLMRSSALRQTQLIDNYIGSDAALMAELALLGCCLEVPEYLFCRRMHSEQYAAVNQTVLDRARWFDPEFNGETYNVQKKLYVQICGFLADSELSWSKKRMTRLSLSANYGKRVCRRWKSVLGKWKRSILRKTVCLPKPS